MSLYQVYKAMDASKDVVDGAYIIARALKDQGVDGGRHFVGGTPSRQASADAPIAPSVLRYRRFPRL